MSTIINKIAVKITKNNIESSDYRHLAYIIYHHRDKINVILSVLEENLDKFIEHYENNNYSFFSWFDFTSNGYRYHCFGFDQFVFGLYVLATIGKFTEKKNIFEKVLMKTIAMKDAPYAKREMYKRLSENKNFGDSISEDLLIDKNPPLGMMEHFINTNIEGYYNRAEAYRLMKMFEEDSIKPEEYQEAVILFNRIGHWLWHEERQKVLDIVSKNINYAQ